MTRFAPALLISFALLSSASPARAQAQRDARAVAVVSQSLSALAGSTALGDLTLQGSVAYTAGSDQESGAVTLLASGNRLSNLALNLSGGARNEIRNGPAGLWSGPDGVQYPMALHNCWPDADWFYPGLSFAALSSDPQLGLAYVGPESKDGLPVIHIQQFRVVPGQTAQVTAQIQALSTEDIYLDASSLLPLFVDYNAHPDNDFNRNIPVELGFTAYQRISGVVIPTHEQKFFNGTLQLDLSITSAVVNSGLPPSDFNATVQNASLKAPPGAVAPVSPPATRSAGKAAGEDTRATKAAGGAR